eukprot:GDKJ01028719.1.p1 GENE.GDKJ01028719.1~~GDKJ01028719.1.p1  ORF type:complete len:401 (-),score=106.59 GDKJ01028719.1:104-1306(-)
METCYRSLANDADLFKIANVRVYNADRTQWTIDANTHDLTLNTQNINHEEMKLIIDDIEVSKDDDVIVNGRGQFRHSVQVKSADDSRTLYNTFLTKSTVFSTTYIHKFEEASVAISVTKGAYICNLRKNDIRKRVRLTCTGRYSDGVTSSTSAIGMMHVGLRPSWTLPSDDLQAVELLIEEVPAPSAPPADEGEPAALIDFKCLDDLKEEDRAQEGYFERRVVVEKDALPLVPSAEEEAEIKKKKREAREKERERRRQEREEMEEKKAEEDEKEEEDDVHWTLRQTALVSIYSILTLGMFTSLICCCRRSQREKEMRRKRELLLKGKDNPYISSYSHYLYYEQKKEKERVKKNEKDREKVKKMKNLSNEEKNVKKNHSENLSHDEESKDRSMPSNIVDHI